MSVWSPHTTICNEIFDENSHPSEEEIREYALKIGINPESEPHLLHLARDGLMQALPPDWKPCFDQQLDSWYYFNFRTGESRWEHPLDDVYRMLVKKGRSESLSSLGDDDSKTSLKEDLKSYEEAASSALASSDMQQHRDPLLKAAAVAAGARKPQGLPLAPLRKSASVGGGHGGVGGVGGVGPRSSVSRSDSVPLMSSAAPDGPSRIELGSGSFAGNAPPTWEAVVVPGGLARIDIDKMDLGTAPGRGPRPGRDRLAGAQEKHPRTMQRSELTLSGGGSMFLKSNKARSPDTPETPLPSPASAAVAIEVVTEDPSEPPPKSILRPASGLGGSASPAAASPQRSRASPAAAKPLWDLDPREMSAEEKQMWRKQELEEEQRKSVRFNLDKELDIRFHVSDSEENGEEEEEREIVEKEDEGWNSDEEADNERLIAGVKVSDILNLMDASELDEPSAKDVGNMPVMPDDSLETQMERQGLVRNVEDADEPSLESVGKEQEDTKDAQPTKEEKEEREEEEVKEKAKDKIEEDISKEASVEAEVPEPQAPPELVITKVPSEDESESKDDEGKEESTSEPRPTEMKPTDVVDESSQESKPPIELKAETKPEEKDEEGDVDRDDAEKISKDVESESAILLGGQSAQEIIADLRKALDLPEREESEIVLQEIDFEEGQLAASEVEEGAEGKEEVEEEKETAAAVSGTEMTRSKRLAALRSRTVLPLAADSSSSSGGGSSDGGAGDREDSDEPGPPAAATAAGPLRPMSAKAPAAKSKAKIVEEAEEEEDVEEDMEVDAVEEVAAAGEVEHRHKRMLRLQSESQRMLREFQDQLQANTDSVIRRLEEQHAHQLVVLRERLLGDEEEQRARWQAESSMRLDALRQELAKEEQNLRASMEREIAALHASASEERESALAKERERLDIRLTEERERLESDASRQLEALREAMEARMEEARARLEVEAKEHTERLSSEMEARRGEIAERQMKDLESLEARAAAAAEARLEERVAALEAAAVGQLEARVEAATEARKQELLEAQRLALEEMSRQHLEARERLRQECKDEEEALRRDHAERLEETRVRLEQERQRQRERETQGEEREREKLLESASSSRNNSSENVETSVTSNPEMSETSVTSNTMRSDKVKAVSSKPVRVLERLRCEKRLLEDKYRSLKEKYIRLKTDVKLSIERRKRRSGAGEGGGGTTGSETERSTSHTRTSTAGGGGAAGPTGPTGPTGAAALAASRPPDAESSRRRDQPSAYFV